MRRFGMGWVRGVGLLAGRATTKRRHLSRLAAGASVLWLPLLVGCDGWVLEVGRMGSGVEASETRELPAFDWIEAHSIVDVVVREGAPVSGVRVVCDDNLIELVQTRVSAGVLTVDLAGGATSSAGCAVETGNMDLVGIEASGVVEVSVTGPVWTLTSVKAFDANDIDIRLRAGSAPDQDLVEAVERPGVEDAPRPVADTLVVEAYGTSDIAISGIVAERVEVLADDAAELSLDGQVDHLWIASDGVSEVQARPLSARQAELDSDSAGDITATATERVVATTRSIGDITVYGDPAERSVEADNVGEVAFR